MSSIEEQAFKKDYQMDFTPSSRQTRRGLIGGSLQATSVSASLAGNNNKDDSESPFNQDNANNANFTRRDSDDAVSSHFTSVSERRGAPPPLPPTRGLSSLLDPASVHEDTVRVSSSKEKYQSSFQNNLNLSTLSQLMMSTPYTSNNSSSSNKKTTSSDRRKSVIYPDQELSEIEAMILRSSEPMMINESEKEEIEVLGQRGLWLNKAEVEKWRGDIPISSYSINVDSQPEVITKRSTQTIEYIQEVMSSYLQKFN
jgi:hypothetical protein